MSLSLLTPLPLVLVPRGDHSSSLHYPSRGPGWSACVYSTCTQGRMNRTFSHLAVFHECSAVLLVCFLFLKNVLLTFSFFHLLYFKNSIYIMYHIQNICHGLFTLSVRLLVNSRLSIVKLLSQNLHLNFLLILAPTCPIVQGLTAYANK